MAIFRQFLRRRLAVVLTCCILVITLLLSAQLALHGAKAQGGTSSSAQPAVACQAGQPCTFLASAGFSATQGQDQWSYLFSQDQETTFTPMTYDSTNNWWFGSEGGCLIGTNWQHPGFAQCDSVRTWMAPGSGSVTLTANGDLTVATNCPSSTNTNGVQIRVLLNGVQFWPTTGWQTIPNGSTFTFPTLTATVQAADQLQFVVAHGGPNNACDTTTWDPLVTLTLPPPPPPGTLCTPNPTAISSTFNGIPIPAGDFILFTAVLRLQGPPVGQPVTVFFTNQAITFTANGLTYTTANAGMPDAQVTIDPSATQATTTFDTTTGTWKTVTPPKTAAKIFLSGYVFAPSLFSQSGDLPGGIDPVTWTGTIRVLASVPLTVSWQWAAAVYTSLSTDNNALGIKPVDDNQASQYQNSDHAGTPENFTADVTGGARGGGGENFTGGLSDTASVACGS